MKKITHYLAIVIATAQLSACQTTSSDKSNSENVSLAIEKAAMTATISGSSNAALIALERKYKRNSSNPKIALEYARNLRQANYLDMASMILTPFAKSDKAKAGINTEMSMIELSRGNYDLAENYAKQAVMQNATDYAAYQNLGIALDAKEMHPEAERAFRKGLENWQGDPTTIMNNLALNLATQGFVDESIEILEKAQSLSPDRVELERNLRIIRTLNER